MTERDYLAKSKKFAVLAGCSTEDSWMRGGSEMAETVGCLRGLSDQQVITAYATLMANDESSGSQFWHPTVDGQDGILPLPLNQLARRRPNVPVLTGGTGDFYNFASVVVPALGRGLSVNLTRLNDPQRVRDVCNLQISQYKFGATNVDAARSECIERYSNLKNPENNQDGSMLWHRRATQAGSSMINWEPAYRNAKYYVDNGNENVYLYSLDYRRQQDHLWWKAAGSFANLELGRILFEFKRPLHHVEVSHQEDS